MAAKCLLNSQNIFMAYSCHVERIYCSVLKRNIHFRLGFLDYIKRKKSSRGFKLLAGTACLTLGSYLILSLGEDESARKARELKMAGLRKSCNFIADVVEVAADAVVHITAENKTFLFSNILAGSGFIITSNGLIITNAHVVGNEYGKNVVITLRNGRTFPGVVKDVDETIDLALIDINSKNLPVLKLGSGTDLRPGEWVAAIGSPFFLSNSVTAGVVSSVQRRASEIGFPNRKISYIQTDTTVVSGSSGGPLVNLDGEVVGVNTMTLTPGISFAIPVEYVLAFVKKYKDMSERGRKKFYIGLSYLPLTPAILNELHSKGIKLPDNLNYGIYVWKIEPNSPAYICGLKSGDVIYEVEGRNISDIKCLYEKFEEKNTVLIKFYRKGLYYETKLTPKRQF